MGSAPNMRKAEHDNPDDKLIDYNGSAKLITGGLVQHMNSRFAVPFPEIHDGKVYVFRYVSYILHNSGNTPGLNKYAGKKDPGCNRPCRSCNILAKNVSNM